MVLRNKIALVTGGSRGLGKNAAIRLAEKGVDVIITYYQQAKTAEAVVTEIEKTDQRTAAALQLDVGDIGSFNRFVEQLSGILENKWKTSE